MDVPSLKLGIRFRTSGRYQPITAVNREYDSRYGGFHLVPIPAKAATTSWLHQGAPSRHHDATPPKKAWFSTSKVFAPARADPSAAPIPAGPPPTTRTSGS
jgi:hypothetical protein